MREEICKVCKKVQRECTCTDRDFIKATIKTISVEDKERLALIKQKLLQNLNPREIQVFLDSVLSE